MSSNVITLNDRRRLGTLLNGQHQQPVVEDGSVSIDGRRTIACRALEYAIRQAYALLGNDAAGRLVQEVQAAVRGSNERKW